MHNIRQKCLIPPLLWTGVILHYYTILWTFAHSQFLQIFFDCKDLKTGGRDIGILWTIYKFTNTFLPGSNSSFVGGKIYGLLKDSWEFGILVKNFNNKIVIITNNNNA